MPRCSGFGRRGDGLLGSRRIGRLGHAARPGRRVHAALGAAVAASLLFGLYHYAHSPPFDSHGMVALLAAVGLVASLFFVSRDTYGTVAFHNWLGVFGVAQAMRTSGTLDALAALRVPLLAMGALSVAVLVGADRLWIRAGSGTGADQPGARPCRRGERPKPSLPPDVASLNSASHLFRRAR